MHTCAVPPLWIGNLRPLNPQATSVAGEQHFSFHKRVACVLLLFWRSSTRYSAATTEVPIWFRENRARIRSPCPCLLIGQQLLFPSATTSINSGPSLRFSCLPFWLPTTTTASSAAAHSNTKEHCCHEHSKLGIPSRLIATARGSLRIIRPC